MLGGFKVSGKTLAAATMHSHFKLLIEHKHVQMRNCVLWSLFYFKYTVNEWHTYISLYDYACPCSPLSHFSIFKFPMKMKSFGLSETKFIVYLIRIRLNQQSEPHTFIHMNLLSRNPGSAPDFVYWKKRSISRLRTWSCLSDPTVSIQYPLPGSFTAPLYESYGEEDGLQTSKQGPEVIKLFHTQLSRTRTLSC